MTNHCGSCKHLNVSESYLAHNKLGLYRCNKKTEIATFVPAKKETACTMHEKLKNLDARRKLISERAK